MFGAKFRVLNMPENETSNLSLNGFNDWRLPTKDEWDMLRRKKDEVSGFYGIKHYWSSSEFEGNSIIAWYGNLNLRNGTSDKRRVISVRAVRSF